MGCINTTPVETSTKKLNTTESKEELNKTFKTLILGAEESGKSTIFNCTKLINNEHNVMDVANLQHITSSVRDNCVWEIINILEQSQLLYDQNSTVYSKCLIDMNIQNESDIRTIEHSDGTVVEQLDCKEMTQLGQSIENVWNLPAIKETFSYRLKAKYHCVDNIDYFFNKITEVMSKNWIITKEDLLKARCWTTGIKNYKYEINDGIINIFDLGSQRSVRIFMDVKCGIFVIGTSDFCKVLFENEKQIHLLESLEWFEEICGEKWFKQSKMVLVLNKMDLFREYLRFTPLSFCFGDEYKGRNYMDMNMELRYKIMNKLMKTFLQCYYDDYNVNIPLDVINIIGMYFDISEECLDLCVKDGIEFIKQKCIAIHEKSNENDKGELHIFETVAISIEQIRNLMDKVFNILSDTKPFYSD
eukprot:499894_1